MSGEFVGNPPEAKVPSLTAPDQEAKRPGNTLKH